VANSPLPWRRKFSPKNAERVLLVCFDPKSERTFADELQAALSRRSNAERSELSGGDGLDEA
jgi:hypothetical protein